jgi:sugar phosphate isomerase/epimerase
MKEYRLSVSSIGSPLGKIKLFEFDDGTPARHVAPTAYLESEVTRVCQIARALGARLVRGFSFYPPRDANPEQHVDRAVERLSEIVARCADHDLIFGLEVEANLVGRNGWLLREISNQINHPSLVLVFDGANLAVQGFSATEIFDQYLAMKPALGWLHVKDYCPNPASDKLGGHVDEERLDRFVPVGYGASAYERIFRDVRGSVHEWDERLGPRQIGGIYLELEPHLRAGGQFGGYSGPDGFGLALRSLCRLLEANDLTHDLLDWSGMENALREGEAPAEPN